MEVATGGKRERAETLRYAEAMFRKESAGSKSPSSKDREAIQKRALAEVAVIRNRSRSRLDKYAYSGEGRKSEEQLRLLGHPLFPLPSRDAGRRSVTPKRRWSMHMSQADHLDVLARDQGAESLRSKNLPITF